MQLLLHKNAQQALAHCIHQPQRLIGRAEVDNCLAASSAHICSSAYLVTSGAFADAAVIYAVDLEIKLVDGRALQAARVLP